MRFAKNSPLVLEVKRILRDNSRGMLPGEIRRALLQCGRQGVLENDIAEILSLNATYDYSIVINYDDTRRNSEGT